MLSTTIKRTIATTLSGAAIAGTLSAPAASAMPIDPVGAPGDPSNVWIVPSQRSTSPAAVETAVLEADPLAPERYYASYGDPAPLPRDDPDEAYWLPIALSLAGVLSIVAVSSTQAKRIRVRRRAARPAV